MSMTTQPALQDRLSCPECSATIRSGDDIDDIHTAADRDRVALVFGCRSCGAELTLEASATPPGTLDVNLRNDPP